MTRFRVQLGIAVLAGAMVSSAAVPVDQNKTATKPAVKAKAKSKRRRYRSSAGKAAPSAAAAKKSPVKTAARKVAAVRRRVIPRGPAVSAKTRMEAHEGVFTKVANGEELPVENAAALVPFFELLYRHQKGEMPGPVRILQYGDSHTAADEWTGALRSHFQEKFGDGGSGYSLAGRPWNGYRREDVRTGSTRGWHTDGLVGRPGDGMYGLGGVSMTTRSPHEAVYLLADGQQFELFYLQQPGGGSLQVYDNGNPVEQISTDGEEGPGYYHYDAVAGTHKFEVETLDHAPVRLFGWVAENSTGVTYETLGINGAAASIMLDWNEPLLRSNIERRNPSLIVLAYGTNEAGRKDWTVDTYRDMFSALIGRLREAAPTATILIIGPPDRWVHTRKGWHAMDQIDTIVEAQRQAAASSGCAFWDERAKMGGKGSMQQWVMAGMAQYDHVHFTGTGYKVLGDAVFRDLMGQYDVFLKARADVIAAEQDAKLPAPAK
ncbi:MAG TPA: SGNH/GDSL hydrolase family protein [Bryobacteraceae bacterium]|nr:SGNH/GDSL hydrolase family protein [Bryobacteraceae bacterium]